MYPGKQTTTTTKILGNKGLPFKGISEKREKHGF